MVMITRHYNTLQEANRSYQYRLFRWCSTSSSSSNIYREREHCYVKHTNQLQTEKQVACLSNNKELINAMIDKHIYTNTIQVAKRHLSLFGKAVIPWWVNERKATELDETHYEQCREEVEMQSREKEEQQEEEEECTSTYENYESVHQEEEEQWESANFITKLCNMNVNIGSNDKSESKEVRKAAETATTTKITTEPVYTFPLSQVLRYIRLGRHHYNLSLEHARDVESLIAAANKSHAALKQLNIITEHEAHVSKTNQEYQLDLELRVNSSHDSCLKENESEKEESAYSEVWNAWMVDKVRTFCNHNCHHLLVNFKNERKTWNSVIRNRNSDSNQESTSNTTVSTRTLFTKCTVYLFEACLLLHLSALYGVSEQYIEKMLNMCLSCTIFISVNCFASPNDIKSASKYLATRKNINEYYHHGHHNNNSINNHCAGIEFMQRLPIAEFIQSGNVDEMACTSLHWAIVHYTAAVEKWELLSHNSSELWPMQTTQEPFNRLLRSLSELLCHLTSNSSFRFRYMVSRSQAARWFDVEHLKQNKTVYDEHFIANQQRRLQLLPIMWLTFLCINKTLLELSVKNGLSICNNCSNYSKDVSCNSMNTRMKCLASTKLNSKSKNRVSAQQRKWSEARHSLLRIMSLYSVRKAESIEFGAAATFAAAAATSADEMLWSLIIFIYFRDSHAINEEQIARNEKMPLVQVKNSFGVKNINKYSDNTNTWASVHYTTYSEIATLVSLLERGRVTFNCRFAQIKREPYTSHEAMHAVTLLHMWRAECQYRKLYSINLQKRQYNHKHLFLNMKSENMLSVSRIITFRPLYITLIHLPLCALDMTSTSNWQRCLNLTNTNNIGIDCRNSWSYEVLQQCKELHSLLVVVLLQWQNAFPIYYTTLNNIESKSDSVNYSEAKMDDETNDTSVHNGKKQLMSRLRANINHRQSTRDECAQRHLLVTSESSEHKEHVLCDGESSTHFLLSVAHTKLPHEINEQLLYSIELLRNSHNLENASDTELDLVMRSLHAERLELVFTACEHLAHLHHHTMEQINYIKEHEQQNVQPPPPQQQQHSEYQRFDYDIANALHTSKRIMPKATMETLLCEYRKVQKSIETIMRVIKMQWEWQIAPEYMEQCQNIETLQQQHERSIIKLIDYYIAQILQS